MQIGALAALALLRVSPAALAADTLRTEPTIEVRTHTLSSSARSVDALLKELQADERMRAHALTRSRLALQIELMPEPLQTDAGQPANAADPSTERCPTLSRRDSPAAPECRPRACRLSAFQVRLEIDLTLPDWQPAHPPAQRDEALWRALQERLQAHEHRHREHAEAAARRLHRRLEQRLDRIEAIDCQRLRTDLESLRQIEVQNLQLRDRTFDQGSMDVLTLERTPR